MKDWGGACVGGSRLLFAFLLGTVLPVLFYVGLCLLLCYHSGSLSRGHGTLLVDPSLVIGVSADGHFQHQPNLAIPLHSVLTTTRTRTAPGTAYSSTPIHALITAATKTDDEKIIDVQQAKKYLAISTSPKVRQKALVDLAMAGVYVVVRPSYIRPIYVITAANLTTCNGTVAKQFVAQGVNDSIKLQPKAVPLDITGNVPILIKDPSHPLPEIWKTCVGSSFVKADVTHIPALHNLITDDGITYAVAVIPKSMSILWDCPGCHRGALDDVGYRYIQL